MVYTLIPHEFQTGRMTSPDRVLKTRMKNVLKGPSFDGEKREFTYDRNNAESSALQLLSRVINVVV